MLREEATVRYKKVKNAAGYQIKYSAKKNMKGAKTKTTTKVKYTIKKLKSRSSHMFRLELLQKILQDRRYTVSSQLRRKYS